MNQLSANIICSGMGCQERGIINSSLFDFDVKCTSEIDMDAILMYATLHCGLNENQIKNWEYPATEQMISDLKRMNIGKFKNNENLIDWDKQRDTLIRKYWLANYLSDNIGDITKVSSLPYADLWACSFPGNKISTADVSLKSFAPTSDTQSSLIWHVLGLLKNAIKNNSAPQYLIFENVKNITSKKFKMEYDILLQMLDDFEYNTYCDVLDASDCGMPHHRERAYIICIRKDIDKKLFEFPSPYNDECELDDIMEKDVPESYYINPRIENNLINRMLNKGQIKNIKKKSLKEGISDERYIIGSLNYIASERFFTGINKNKSIAIISGYPTGLLELHVFEDGASYKIRKYTPKENLRLLGFNDIDNEKLKDMNISDSVIYRITGSGSVTTCYTLIAQHLYKAQYDNNFSCYDELMNNIMEDN